MKDPLMEEATGLLETAIEDIISSALCQAIGWTLTEAARRQAGGQLIKDVETDSIMESAKEAFPVLRRKGPI